MITVPRLFLLPGFCVQLYKNEKVEWLSYLSISHKELTF